MDGYPSSDPDWGRNFVDKPEASVIAEAKLDRELLSTDPVPHSSTPHFEQELAWEVDHASLRQYRLQRTSIKLQIFAINYNASPCSRNLLGYIILDVRSATERKTFKWFQVLNSKLRPCPEVYCGLYIDPCSSSSLVASGDLNATPLEVERFVENLGNQLVDGFEIRVGNVNSPVILRFNVNNHDVQRHINGSHSQVKAGPKTNGGGSPAQALNMDTTLVQMQTNQRSASETLPSQQPITLRTTAPQIPTNYMNESVQLRRFCYTIELKTIRACCEPSPSKETYVYAKYVYPLFGTTNPIMTLPPVQFSANEEKHFFQGYCAFELAADFSEEPLNVEILGRCSDGSNGLESSLGWAVIPLGEIFPEPVIEMSNSQRRFMTGVADVKLNGKPMAQIKYSLILDDFGVYNSSTTAEITSLNQIEGLNIDGLKEVPDSTPKLPTDIRQTSEYRAALELELWKAKEEERFKNNLKLREQKMLMVFAEEWKRREIERESLCKKKMQEYQMLEDKLRAALEALMERERQLTLKEAALNAAERDLERNLEIREKDLLNDVQRKIRDAEQAISSEQQRNFHLNNELAVLREKCKGLEQQLIEHHLKATTTSTTGVTADTKDGLDQAKRDEEEIRRLQFELVRLTTELTNAQSQISTMERRLDGALRGRARYKDLWTRALQEVTRLRQEAANATKQELQRREAEVEGLRREQCLLLRAGDTRACLHHDTPAQQNPADPQSLGEAASGNQEEVPLPFSVALQKVNDPALDAQLRRLRDERECLLTSGVYYEDDVLIVDLDREIKRLQTLISNPV
ncbi:Centrosomal protein [Echinococcus granulosus]|uniref:Centrosomal protein n=1 Tax=Echinococcus granulosus TaxID=6210 RepID=W6UM01_ECHGR|nr:Centrosomal protein [Echinococcus granulosus]EUB62570.1 Centrosomal protein [Echinococcus granulosus]